MTKKKICWRTAKRLIKAECDRYNSMIYGSCIEPGMLMGSNQWKKWIKGRLNIWQLEHPIGTLEWNEDLQMVIFSHFSSESPTSGFHVDRDYVKIDRIDALHCFLLAAYYTKMGRKIQEAEED